MKKKIILVFGTRPEAVKMAPLYDALSDDPDFEAVTVVTAQHREMLDQVMDIFGMKAAHDLDLMKPNQPITYVMTQGLEALHAIFAAERPEAVLVHGDTTTTFVASLAAFYARIPVGHVEAGLRTGNIYSPFPEEMNRRLTGTICTWHFAPTEAARRNLATEGVPSERIVITGNTVIDALRTALSKPYDFEDPDLARAASVPGERLILVTAHRRENFGAPLESLFRAILEIADRHPDTRFIYPVHMNPNVTEPAHRILKHPRVLLCKPLEYLPFINLMARSHLILTDSGGLQEEGPSLGKPVIVFRDTTERPEAIEAGTALLAGNDFDGVLGALDSLLSDATLYSSMANAVNPFGDGHAAGRIVSFLRGALCPGRSMA